MTKTCKNCRTAKKYHGTELISCKKFEPEKHNCCQGENECINSQTFPDEKPQKGSLPKRFHKEGLRKTRDGYIEIYSPHHPNQNKNKCVLESRLVMERYLGRFLTKKEVVHHINHDKQNNRIENLELFSSVGKHTISHHIVRDKNGKFTKHGK